jgi:predicted kinase
MTDADGDRHALRIVVPDPALIVLIGPAGAGKSTFAQRWFAPEEILSSDALRAVVSGDANDQSATGAAFAILHRQLGRRLAAGLLTVVDATNVQHSSRRSLLVRARRAGHPSVAIVLNLPRLTVHERNAARLERVVAPDVIDVQLEALERSLRAGQLAGEGFVAVHVLATANEVDWLDVVRSRTDGP